jgi:hypothetical protein
MKSIIALGILIIAKKLAFVAMDLAKRPREIYFHEE